MCSDSPASDPILAERWQQAQRSWLSQQRSAHTANAYRQDLAQFTQFVGKPLWQVTAQDIADWKTQLGKLGYQPNTLNRKLAALSSFFHFAQTECDLTAATQYGTGQHGSRTSCANPVRSVQRESVLPYATCHALSADEVKQALHRINRDTKTGARDYALILTGLYTGRMPSELVRLRWQDFRVDDQNHCVYYTWIDKHEHPRTDEFPLPAWYAILHLLTITERIDTIQPDEYIFQPVCNQAHRLPQLEEPLPANRTISVAMLNRIVKRRFSAAGLDASQITAHTLRHTAAALRWRNGAGEDAPSLCYFLNHADIRVTRSYLQTQKRPVDRGWTTVEALLEE